MNSRHDRRRFVSGLMLCAVGAGGLAGRDSARAAMLPEPMQPLQVPGVELVMNIVATCSDPVPTGGPEVKGPSRDGIRDEIWPITGGRFWGRGMRGKVVPGGGDFPVQRPDGVDYVDALYRLLTDDGVTIVIHNKGLAYPPSAPGKDDIYRLQPEFYAPAGRYAWLNKGLFVATLIYPVPHGLEMARGPHENDRLIQVFKIT